MERKVDSLFPSLGCSSAAGALPSAGAAAGAGDLPVNAENMSKSFPIRVFLHWSIIGDNQIGLRLEVRHRTSLVRWSGWEEWATRSLRFGSLVSSRGGLEEVIGDR